MIKTHFIVPYHVYPYELLVVYNYSPLDAERVLKRLIPCDMHDQIDSLFEESQATTLMLSNNTTVIYFKPFIPKKNLQGVIVHEAFHATTFLMDCIGQTLSQDSEESYAYLIQYIVERINAGIERARK